MGGRGRAGSDDRAADRGEAAGGQPDRDGGQADQVPALEDEPEPDAVDEQQSQADRRVERPGPLLTLTWLQGRG
jgi:hypothetical protein